MYWYDLGLDGQRPLQLRHLTLHAVRFDTINYEVFPRKFNIDTTGTSSPGSMPRD